MYTEGPPVKVLYWYTGGVQCTYTGVTPLLTAVGLWLVGLHRCSSVVAAIFLPAQLTASLPKIGTFEVLQIDQSRPTCLKWAIFKSCKLTRVESGPHGLLPMSERASGESRRKSEYREERMWTWRENGGDGRAGRLKQIEGTLCTPWKIVHQKNADSRRERWTRWSIVTARNNMHPWKASLRRMRTRGENVGRDGRSQQQGRQKLAGAMLAVRLLGRFNQTEIPFRVDFDFFLLLLIGTEFTKTGGKGEDGKVKAGKQEQGGKIIPQHQHHQHYIRSRPLSHLTNINISITDIMYHIRISVSMSTLGQGLFHT